MLQRSVGKQQELLAELDDQQFIVARHLGADLLHDAARCANAVEQRVGPEAVIQPEDGQGGQGGGERCSTQQGVDQQAAQADGEYQQPGVAAQFGGLGGELGAGEQGDGQDDEQATEQPTESLPQTPRPAASQQQRQPGGRQQRQRRSAGGDIDPSLAGREREEAKHQQQITNQQDHFPLPLPKGLVTQPDEPRQQQGEG